MDDAGTSSESPTLKQAQTKLEEAQTKLEEAQTELKQAQTDWLNATENQHIHERMVQSAERMVQSATENVQSAKKMLDHWLEQQPGRADSSEGLRGSSGKMKLSSRRSSGKMKLSSGKMKLSSRRSSGRWLKMKRCWWRPSWIDTLWHRFHSTHQPHLMDSGISVHRSTTERGVALFSKTFSQMTFKWSLGGYGQHVGIPSFQPLLSTLYPKMASTSSRMNWVLKSTILAIAYCFFAI